MKNGLAVRLVELDLARLEIALRTGNAPAAGKALSNAIVNSARRGIVRPFIDHAQSLALVVNDTWASAWPFAHPQERAFFAGICARLPLNSALHHDLFDLQTDDHRVHGALTPREVELLTLLETGLSNQQIADYTHVSITTVKWHLQNLYRKLGESNRLAALARARSQGLLAQWTQPPR
ncbi:LuxR C-terminal-related transcriptional regulator [Pseudomonas sp. GD03860]|uniref:LuxR C-terminal-related transcriptional regulator n=1 Tax=Pseudomonas sp. GD03860 TaxID=2975389 RepID=UPI00093F2F52|nr:MULTISPECIES: LuxR C-terminal-related transcriptional regulator [Pseudomonas]MDH0639332.1 LuxR C-terminal-related transcriptional regulator [Pseudomonas sp. GD03860]